MSLCLVGCVCGVLVLGVWVGGSADELYVGVVGQLGGVVEVEQLTAEGCVTTELLVKFGSAGERSGGGCGG